MGYRFAGSWLFITLRHAGCAPQWRVRLATLSGIFVPLTLLTLVILGLDPRISTHKLLPLNRHSREGGNLCLHRLGLFYICSCSPTVRNELPLRGLMAVIL